jgi:hypothetical protein
MALLADTRPVHCSRSITFKHKDQSLEKKGQQGYEASSEYIGLINYCIMGLIHLKTAQPTRRFNSEETLELSKYFAEQKHNAGQKP